MHGRRGNAWCWALAGLGLLLTQTASHALYRDGAYWPTSSDGTTSVPICFQSTGEYNAQDESRLRSLVQEALAATWGRWTRIKFSGFGDCGAGTPAVPTLTITLTETPYGKPQWGGSGDIPDQQKHTSGSRGYQLIDNRLYGWLALRSGTTDRRALGVVTHEVGHALAFEHEQSRPDAVGFCPDGDSILPGTVLTTGYDDISIMNYCSPISRLSWTDIRGAQGPYGSSAAGTWLNALPALAHLALF
jgi:astacin (peptidase family M12A)